jgi:hypothetical protein
MTPADLETLARGAVRALPAPRAPQTLVPRVMRAVQAWAERPWYARAWFTWPVACQAVSVAALALVIVGGLMLGPRAEAAASAALSIVRSQVVGNVANVAPPVEATASGAGILWRTLIEPLATYAIGVIVLMCLACAAFGTALNRVVIERAEQR